MAAFPFTELLTNFAPRFPKDARWAVTCGSAVTLHGLEYHPSDLDFFLPYDDLLRMESALQDLPVAFPLAWRTSEGFHSYFGRFQVDGIEVDFVGDFSIERDAFRYAWGADHPCWQRRAEIALGDLRVPVYSLEDLLLLYLALPNEQVKLDLIARGLHARGADWNYLGEMFERWPAMEVPARHWLTL